MTQTNLPSYQYQVGGGLPTNAPTYVKRKADDELYRALKDGEFCYVLNSRQMGKSSLRVQTMERLHNQGFACVAIDITNIGTADITLEQWYAGIIDSIINSLELYDSFDLNDWWMQEDLLSPVNKLSKFFDSVLLKLISQKIVIFIDEIDSILSLNFPVDDFFALIRECYNKRASQPDFQRLTFALLGVTTPSDLIQDKRRTPFNIGRAIELTGFELAEAEPLALGLSKKTDRAIAVMEAVLYWTGGQPFLTQKLCKLILNHHGVIPEDGINEWVGELVQSGVIDNWEAQDEPEHLRTIRDRILRGGGQLTGRLLAIYKEVLEGENLSPNLSLPSTEALDVPPSLAGKGVRGLGQSVRIADTPEQVYLRLSGLVVEQQGNLRVYNYIYESIFNLDWVNRELKNLRPDFYATAFEAWVESNYEDNSHLLRGKQLGDALAWAEGRSLSNQDYRFITASQKWEFEQARKKTQRQTIIGGVVLAASVALAATAAVFAGAANQQRTAAVSQRNQATQQREAAVSQRDRANQQKQVAESALKQAQSETKKANQEKQTATKQVTIARKQATTAQQQAKNAQRQQLIAQNNLKTAAQRQQAAEVKVKQAEQSFTNAQQKLQQTEQAAAQQIQSAQVKVSAANKQAGEAQSRAKKAQNEVKKAQVSLKQAQQTRKQALKEAEEARQGTELERLANVALRQFEYNPAPQVVATAMEVGRRLKAVVKDGQPLEKYPATSPMLVLNTVLDIPKRKTLRGHQSTIRHAAFSPDGQRIVTASNDGTAKVWDINGQLLQTLSWHQEEVDHAAFSPDGKRIVTASGDNTAKVWDINGQLLQTLKGHQKQVFHAAFSPDGQRIVTASTDKTAKVWDINGQLLQTLKGHQERLQYAAFSPDGQRIVTASNDGTAKVWDINGQLLQTLKGHQEWLQYAAFSPDGQRIVTASEDKTAKVWDINGQLLQTLKGHQSTVRHAAFSPDGQRIVTASVDNTAKVWEINGQLLQTFSGHQEAVDHAAFSPDGQRIVTASEDKTAKVWDINGQLLQTLKGHQEAVFHAAFSPDGKRIVTASSDKTAKVWRMESLDELLARGCDWLEDYFVENPEARKRTGCVQK